MKFKLLFSLLIPFFLFADEHIFPLGDLGNVRYVHENNQIQKIERLEPSGEVIYTHTYNYNQDKQLISETLIGNLGDVIYENPLVIQSPYHLETREYDSRQNLVKYTLDDTTREYSYNTLNELITEESTEDLIYDAQGNLIQKGDTLYTYGDNHQLLTVTTPTHEVTYAYDTIGMRISKTTNGVKTSYLHSGINELAILDDQGNLQQLRIPGISIHPDLVRAIAIETSSTIYAPIHDVQGNIIKLIDLITREITTLTQSDPFGRGLATDSVTPWIFAGKNFDPETGLVYFGHRFYCPAIKKWLTPDPLEQTQDLYEYCFNNPLSNFDPDGRWTLNVVTAAFGGAATVFTFPAWGPSLALAAVGAVAGYTGYKAICSLNDYVHRKDYRDSYVDDYSMHKTKNYDPTLPKDPEELLEDSDWKETSYPQAKAKGHRKFENVETGDELLYDYGKDNEDGHKAHSHWHRVNPDRS